MVGLGANLYIRTPFGILPMFDAAAYVFGPLLLITSYSSYSKEIRRLLAFALFWLIGGVVSDFYRGTPSLAAFKAAMILVDMFFMIVVSVWVLKRSPRAIFWFGVGVSISMVISLYAFQNGALLSQAIKHGYDDSGSMAAYLAEKQYVPVYVALIVCITTYVPRILFHIPWFVVYGIRLVAGLYMLMHGGARNQFLTTVIGAGIIFLYANNRKFLCVLLKNKVIILIGALIMAFVFNEIYLSLAKNGHLGEEGLEKYEVRKAGESSMLDSRTDIFVNWPFLWRSPLIGAGCEYKDPWGYSQMSKYSPKLKPGQVPLFAGHSVIISAWTTAGIFGLLFWLYVLWLYVKFLGGGMFVLGDLAPFIAAGIVSILWNLFFSPFGARGNYAMNAAFVALMQDRRFRDWMAVHWQRKGLR